MSQINVTTIRNRTGGPPSLDQGVVVGSAATFSSTVSIAGVLTYEDVTNVDSVGIITARTGLKVTAGGINVTAGGINVTAGIGTFAALTGTTGTFSGAVSGTTGTFSGAVSGTTGTFSGAVSGTTGTFTSTGTFASNLTQDAPSTTAGGALLSEGTIYLRPKDSRGDSAAALVVYNDTFTGTGTASITAAGAATLGSLVTTGESSGCSIKSVQSGNTQWALGATTTGNAVIYLDADNGDFSGGQYCKITAYRTGGDFGIENWMTGGDLLFKTENSTRLTIDSAGDATFTGTVSDSKGDVRKIIPNGQSGAYTLVASDVGKYIWAAGTVTVPNNVFSAGDVVSIVSDSASDLTITNSLAVMYMASDGTNAASRTLSAHGMATILFVSATVAYISGAGLS